MGILAACEQDILNILNSTEHLTYVPVPEGVHHYRAPSGGGEAVYTPPAPKISYIPHLRILSNGTASLVSSIGLTIISLIAKLVNKDEYEEWFLKQKEELKETFALLGHVGMMCIRPESARLGLESLYAKTRNLGQ